MRCEGEKTIPQSPSVTAPFTQGGLGAARWSTAAEEGRRASGRGRFFQASAASAEKGGHRNRSDGTGSGAFFEKQKNVVANKCSPQKPLTFYAPQARHRRAKRNASHAKRTKFSAWGRSVCESKGGARKRATTFFCFSNKKSSEQSELCSDVVVCTGLEPVTPSM